MNAKEYLSEIRHLDAKINRKCEQLSALRDIAEKTTSVLSFAPGGSHNPKQKENILAKISDTQTELNAMTDKLADMKSEVLELIYRLENTEQCRVLESRYVKLLNWSKIADGMGKSERSIYRIHADALSQLEKML